MNILVILATFNGRKYIEQQIFSILTQEDVSITLFVFDDGSNDGTIDFLFSKFSLGTYNVNVIQNSSPTGSAASNFLQAIKTIDDKIIDAHDYIALSDQDDIWLPVKLREAVKKLKIEKSDLYMSNLILWNQRLNTTSMIKKSFKQKKYDYLFEGGSAGCTYVMSKQLINVVRKTINRVDNKNCNYFSHDWFIYFVARMDKFKVSIDQRAYIQYRIHETNVHGLLNTFSFYSLKERFKLIMNGWFYYHAGVFAPLLRNDSIESKIYRLYTKNYFTRVYVIFKYNFQLMRSNKKALQFFLISLLPLSIKK